MTLAPEPGRSLGPYELVRRLATGGMAELFLARRAGVGGRSFALKRMLPHLARDPAYVEMFLDEAQLASRLVHPHIVSVEDIGRGGPPYYYVMEYVRGADLLQLMHALAQRDQIMPIECAVAIGIAVCAALDHAHELADERGRPLALVHRDVSLANVLLGQDGSIKLTDFGIARVGRRHRTEPGVLKGKLGYMSPEQCAGAPLDRRSDLFALGVVLYELTTGDRLFSPTRGELEVLERITRGPITPPAELLPGYPAELSAIVMRALQRAPEQRYQTARAMGRDLRTFQRLRRLPAGPAVIASLLQRAFPAASGRRSRQTQQLDELVDALRSIVLPTLPARRDAPEPHAPVASPGTRHAPAPPRAGSEAPVAEAPVAPPRHRGLRRYLPALLAIALVVLGLGVSAWAAYEYAAATATTAAPPPAYSSGARVPTP